MMRAQALVGSLILGLMLTVAVTSEVEFTILHVNDVHARVEGMKGTGGCLQDENDQFLCDGGWARMLSAAKEFVENASHPVIFVDNGDEFSGTVWSTFYRGEEVYAFKNKFCDEAGFLFCLSGIGNHEFDFGYQPLLDYVKNSNHPTINSNLIDNCAQNSQGTHAESELGNSLTKSITLEISGVLVGFVGYLTTTTPVSSSPPDCIVFQDEATAIQVEIDILKENGVDVIIAIGHSGVDVDLDVSTAVNNLDLIVGGHSHTFLWNEEAQGAIPVQSNFEEDNSGNIETFSDSPADTYPVFAENSEIPVLQAFFGSRYMGALEVSFGENGELQNFVRKSVIVSDARSPAQGGSGFLQDASMQEKVNELLEPIEEFINAPVGFLLQDLDDSVDGLRRIRQVEMPLGNVACDAMLASALKVAPGLVEICMQNGGGIRAGLEAGEVSFGQIFTVFPFGNVISIVKMTGERIHRAAEFSILGTEAERGGFLHFSKGFQLVYDPLLPEGSKVVSISLNGVPILNDSSRTYGVVTNAFTRGGGDGYGEIFSGAEAILEQGVPQEDAIADYLRSNPNLCQGTEARVVPLNNPILDGEEVDLRGIEFEPCTFTFTLLHINDMHARVQGMRGSGGCTTEQNNNAECDGGWGRIAAAGKRFVDESPNPVIFVDNGDEFSGTAWSTFYRGTEVRTFLNKLCDERENGGAGFLHCFSGIGNHEFDFGYMPLLEFSRDLNHDIITGNIQDNCVQNSQDGEHATGELGSFFNKQRIIKIAGKRIGFVGYTLSNTPAASSPPGCLEFHDEVLAIGPEIQELKAEGVDVIIVIGHSGIDTDLEIAKQLPDIDLIVGGHSHTFLWNEDEQGPIPAQSRPVENNGEVVGLRKDELQAKSNLYPKFAARDNTPVLQAFFGSRYLGAVDLTFDFNGNLVDYKRKAVILANENSPVAGATVFDATANTDKSKAFGEDAEMMVLVKQLLEPLEEFINIPVGIGALQLETNPSGGANVRNSELPLGNLACDAMMEAFNLKDGLQVDVCMQNGGGIRAPLPEGDISFGNVLEVFPFGNVLSVLEFTGQRMHDVVEFGLSEVENGEGRFLHFGSGFQLIYDPLEPVGSRVKSITLNGKAVEKGSDETYLVVTNNFIARGGDGYENLFSDAPLIVENGQPQEDTLADYLKRNCPACQEIEGRIIPLNNPVDSDGVEIDILGSTFPLCSEALIKDCSLDE